MRTLRAALLLALIFAGHPCPGARGSHPSYLILQGPTVPTPHRPVNRGYYPAHGYAVEPRAYSYGWFGAQPQPQWSRHFGFYRSYTEWSAR